MAGVTKNLGLALLGVSAEDKSVTFEEWRTSINGDAESSNMNILDAAIGADRQRIYSLENRDDLVTKEYLHGKVPDEAGAHQYLTTDGGSVPVWEDKLAHTDVISVDVPSCELSFETEDVVAVFPEHFTLVPGHSYIVTFDGSEYECIARSASGNTVYIGNISIVSSSFIIVDTEEPFIITSTSPSIQDISGQIPYPTMRVTEIGTHHVSVRGINERHTTIPQKYMTNVVGVADTLIGEVDNELCLCINPDLGASDEDIIDAVTHNKPVSINISVPIEGLSITMRGRFDFATSIPITSTENAYMFIGDVGVFLGEYCKMSAIYMHSDLIDLSGFSGLNRYVLLITEAVEFSPDNLPVISVSKGGTGATTAEQALKNLGLTATAAELNYISGVTANVQEQINTLSGFSGGNFVTSINGNTGDVTLKSSDIGAAESEHSHQLTDLSGTLSVANGGTGSTSASAARHALGITPENIGASKSGHLHTASEVGIVYSDSEPIGSAGKIWLKPIE